MEEVSYESISSFNVDMITNQEPAENMYTCNGSVTESVDERDLSGETTHIDDEDESIADINSPTENGITIEEEQAEPDEDSFEQLPASAANNSELDIFSIIAKHQQKQRAQKQQNQHQLLVVVSEYGQAGNRESFSQQTHTLTMLKGALGKDVPYTTLDASDPANFPQRDALLAISGAGTFYPQFFLVKPKAMKADNTMEATEPRDDDDGSQWNVLDNFQDDIQFFGGYQDLFAANERNTLGSSFRMQMSLTNINVTGDTAETESVGSNDNEDGVMVEAEDQQEPADQAESNTPTGGGDEPVESTAPMTTKQLEIKTIKPESETLEVPQSLLREEETENVDASFNDDDDDDHDDDQGDDHDHDDEPCRTVTPTEPGTISSECNAAAETEDDNVLDEKDCELEGVSEIIPSVEPAEKTPTVDRGIMETASNSDENELPNVVVEGQALEEFAEVSFVPPTNLVATEPLSLPVEETEECNIPVVDAPAENDVVSNHSEKEVGGDMPAEPQIHSITDFDIVSQDEQVTAALEERVTSTTALPPPPQVQQDVEEKEGVLTAGDEQPTITDTKEDENCVAPSSTAQTVLDEGESPVAEVTPKTREPQDEAVETLSPSGSRSVVSEKAEEEKTKPLLKAALNRGGVKADRVLFGPLEIPEWVDTWMIIPANPVVRMEESRKQKAIEDMRIETISEVTLYLRDGEERTQSRSFITWAHP